jgi:CRISPR/Cas system-associated exonuclease Cas4 (RecB family)
MNQRIQSPTSINTYLRCPRKYYFKYIRGLEEKPSIHLVRGKAVHRALAGFHRFDITTFKTFEEMKAALLSLFDRTWTQECGKLRVLSFPKETLNEFYEESQEMLIGWLKRHVTAISNGRPKPQTEVKLVTKTHMVMGIIDAIFRNQGKVSLTDYKTSKKDELTQDIKVQMAIYALLYRDNFGVLPDTITIDFLKQDNEVPFRVTEEFTEYAAKLCKHVHERTTSQDEKDYPCLCGGWCEKDFVQNGRPTNSPSET